MWKRGGDQAFPVAVLGKVYKLLNNVQVLS
jgi:hypothetical protein